MHNCAVSFEGCDAWKGAELFSLVSSRHFLKLSWNTAMYIMPLGITTGTVFSFLVAAIVLEYGNW